MPLPSQHPECPTNVCIDCPVHNEAQSEINHRQLTTKKEVRDHAKWTVTNRCPFGAEWTDPLIRKAATNRKKNPS